MRCWPQFSCLADGRDLTSIASNCLRYDGDDMAVRNRVLEPVRTIPLGPNLECKSIPHGPEQYEEACSVQISNVELLTQHLGTQYQQREVSFEPDVVRELARNLPSKLTLLHSPPAKDWGHSIYTDATFGYAVVFTPYHYCFSIEEIT